MRMRLLASLVILFGLLAASGTAAPLFIPQVGGTFDLWTFINVGPNSYTIGDKTFNQFSWTNTTVNPFVTPNPFAPGSLTISFGQFLVAPGQFEYGFNVGGAVTAVATLFDGTAELDAHFRYVLTAPARTIHDVSLEFNGTCDPSQAGVNHLCINRIDETVSSNDPGLAPGVPIGTTLAVLQVTPPPPNSNQEAHADLAHIVTSVNVFKDIHLLATIFDTGNPNPVLVTAQWSSMTQHWSQVPEPSSFAIMGLGIAAIAWAVRKRRPTTN